MVRSPNIQRSDISSKNNNIMLLSVNGEATRHRNQWGQIFEIPIEVRQNINLSKKSNIKIGVASSRV
jgi:hypothetical protein